MENNEEIKDKELEKSKKEEKKDKKKILILLLLLLLALVIIIILLLRGPIIIRDSGDSGGVSLQIDENATVVEKKEQKNVAIPGWGAIEIPANVRKVPVNFFNPIENKDSFYLTFELWLKKEDGSTETIYKSNLVEPGKTINEIELKRVLEEGEYDIIIHVQPYKMDKTLTNNANIESKLIVK